MSYARLVLAGLVSLLGVVALLLPLKAIAQPAPVPAGYSFCEACDVPAVQGTVIRWFQAYVGTCGDPPEVFGPYLTESLVTTAPECFDPATGGLGVDGGVWFRRVTLADEPAANLLTPEEWRQALAGAVLFFAVLSGVRFGMGQA